MNYTTSQLFMILIGGGVLVILLIGLVGIIFRGRSRRDDD
jgi:hypothetical protein